MLQWITFAHHDLTPTLRAKIDSSKTGIIFNTNEKLLKLLKYLDDSLEARTFLVNERFSLADLAVFTALLLLYKVDVQFKSLEKLFVHITRWFFTVLYHPCVKNCIRWWKIIVWLFWSTWSSFIHNVKLLYLFSFLLVITKVSIHFFFFFVINWLRKFKKKKIQLKVHSQCTFVFCFQSN